MNHSRKKLSIASICCFNYFYCARVHRKRSKYCFK
jgi:hypothetical protein